MDAVVQAAIIEVAGLWSIEVVKAMHAQPEGVGKKLVDNFAFVYKQLSSIIEPNS